MPRNSKSLLREWPFHSESFFFKIGVVPRFLNYAQIFWARLRGRNQGDRESPKHRFSQKTADFRRFTLSLGNSSVWRAQETAEDRRFSQETEDFEENRRKPQIGLRHLRCVTFSSALTIAQSLRLKTLKKQGRSSWQPALSGNYCVAFRELLRSYCPRICKRWFPNGGSSLVWRANSRTPL